MMTNETSQFFPANWPSTPFHKGEIEVQKRLGVQKSVDSYAPKFVRPYMSEQHRDFFTSQPFLVIASRDSRGKLWSSMIFASNDPYTTDFITSPDPKTLIIESQPLKGDALEGDLKLGSDLGILGIEFATRRRNRVNGRIVENDGEKIGFQADQSFGNCPQYIKSRDWSWIQDDDDFQVSDDNNSRSSLIQSKRATRLSPHQIQTVTHAETIFLATGYRDEGEDPRYGNDASHRGGPPGGFVQVGQDGKTLWIPDYSGNNHFNTIGNLVMDSRMGVTVPMFDTGGVLQLTGHVSIWWNQEENSVTFPPGALRMLEFKVDEVVEIPTGTFPIKWHSNSENDLKLQVVEKVEESNDVVSFYLASMDEGRDLPAFKPGQHVEVSLRTGGNNKEERVSRSYSLSSYNSPGNHYYRISVKRDPFGIGSSLLHDHVHTGDVLDVQKPAGEFVLPAPSDAGDTLVLLSAGIGMTPILSMLHALKGRSTSLSPPSSSHSSLSAIPNYKQIIWVHSDRNGKHHAFQEESKYLANSIGDRLTTHTAYTRPSSSDHSDFNSRGRITLERLRRLLDSIRQDSTTSSSRREGIVDAFLCGPGAFVGTMEDHLKTLGVYPHRIHSELF